MNPFIIGEAGINHSGSLNNAKKLIEMAKSCGCDAVKFQKRTIDIVYTQEFLAQPRDSQWGTTQRHQKEGLEFTKFEYDEIDRYCREVGIEWFASAWDIPSLEFLRQYNLRYNKIASAMLTQLEFVEEVAKERKLTFISTGMSNYDDIGKVVNLFNKHQTPFVLLHCVSMYPCPDELCQINGMLALKDAFKCRVGYSGHEHGLTPTLLAVVLGAEVIERHITLDRASYGSDQSASLERHGLEMLVREARAIDSMLDSDTNRIKAEEAKIAKKLRYFEAVCA